MEFIKNLPIYVLGRVTGPGVGLFNAGTRPGYTWFGFPVLVGPNSQGKLYVVLVVRYTVIVKYPEFGSLCCHAVGPTTGPRAVYCIYCTEVRCLLKYGRWPMVHARLHRYPDHSPPRSFAPRTPGSFASENIFRPRFVIIRRKYI